MHLDEEPAVVAGRLGSTPHPAPQDDRLMSEHRILRLKPALRLECRGQHGQNETEQPDHRTNLADSVTRKIRIRFSVHTASKQRVLPAPRCRFRGNREDDRGLNPVGILEFVDEDVLEPAANRCPNGLVRADEFVGHDEKIVEIQYCCFLFAANVGGDDVVEHGGERADQPVGDLAEQFAVGPLHVREKRLGLAVKRLAAACAVFFHPGRIAAVGTELETLLFHCVDPGRLSEPPQLPAASCGCRTERANDVCAHRRHASAEPSR